MFYRKVTIVFKCSQSLQLFVRKGRFPASQGRMKKETNGPSTEIQLNMSPLSLIQAAPFLKKRRTLKIGDSLVQRKKQIALLFPKWNFLYNPLYFFSHLIFPCWTVECKWHHSWCHWHSWPCIERYKSLLTNRAFWHLNEPTVFSRFTVGNNLSGKGCVIGFINITP